MLDTMANPNMYNPSMYMPQQQGPTSHVTCGGCQVLLMYPQGASNVRCSRCGTITAAATAGPNTAQIVCNNCRMLLSYPRGAPSVQCALCQHITQVPVYRHVICGNCNIMLMYPDGAESVKCSVCHFVTGVNANRWPGAGGQNPQQPKPETVVVENPPTLDEQGNEIASIAVGVKNEGPAR